MKTELTFKQKLLFYYIDKMSADYLNWEERKLNLYQDWLWITDVCKDEIKGLGSISPGRLAALNFINARIQKNFGELQALRFAKEKEISALIGVPFTIGGNNFR